MLSDGAVCVVSRDCDETGNVALLLGLTTLVCNKYMFNVHQTNQQLHRHNQQVNVQLPRMGALSGSSSLIPPRTHRPYAALRTQISEMTANPRALQWMKGLCWCAKMAKRDQVMATLPAKSPSVVESAYVAAVPSRKSNARKTKIFVQMSGGYIAAFTPKAVKAERRTRRVVHP